MASRRLKRLAWIIGFVAILLAGLFGVRTYILKQIQYKLVEQLQALRDSGYIVAYDSISVNTKKNTVAIYRLSVKRSLDSTLCSTSTFLSAKYIQADGFQIVPLLLRKRLSFEAIEFDSAKVILFENFFTDKSESETERREFSIFVDHIKLPNLFFTYYDSTQCDPNITYTSTSEIKEFVLSFYKDRPSYYNFESLTANDLNINLPKDLYTLTIDNVSLDQTLGIFDLDTLKIKPQLNKIAFGNKKGKEVDRIEGVIPYINLYGLTVDREDSVTLHAKKMTTQLHLKVFRDKRLPFKNNLKPLPMEALYLLPFGLNIDSLILNKSYVEYEEFPADADDSGNVVFTDMFATVKSISNLDPKKNGSLVLLAESKFMDQGVLKVKAVCPANPKEKYAVTGSLRDMDLSRLNRMLEAQARTKVESGRLNNLVFDFEYDDNVSNGELSLDYNDLKLVTYRTEEQILKKKNRKRRKKEENDDEMKAPLKSLVLNALIRKNMDSSLPNGKNTGEIYFVRNKRKSMFNFWSKSMLSGIKSVYNIDKLEDSKLKKLLDNKESD